ncbi:MAG: hypothetical protein ACE5H4_09755 [Candidatus Thorarchaeota archaeon]
MRRWESRRALISLVAVTVFFISSCYAGMAAAAPASTTIGPLSYETTEVGKVEGPMYDSSEVGTSAWWNRDSNSSSDQWTWNHRNWLFGPRPTFEIYHENGTWLDKDSHAEIGETLRFVVTIPKSVFGMGSDLGRVEFNGWMMNSPMNFSADFNFGYESMEVANWYASSTVWNYTISPWDPISFNLITINAGQCSKTSAGDDYIVTFAVAFTGDAPLGLYELYMYVYDTEWTSIGSYNYGSGWEFQGIAVGMSPKLAWAHSFGGSYTLEKLDMEGDVLYSVSRQKDFKMQFNVTGTQVDYAVLGFQMPSWTYEWVTVTSTYPKVETSHGGWQFDEGLQTYIWKASQQVTYIKEVYGEHLERQQIYHDVNDEVYQLVWREEWNNVTSMFEWTQVNESIPVTRHFFIVYNGTSDSFDTFYGYVYHGAIFDEEWDYFRHQEIPVFEPIPVDMPKLYEVNDTLSTAYAVNGDLVIDFVGHFTDEMSPTDEASYLNFFDKVMGPGNHMFDSPMNVENPRQGSTDYSNAKAINIETPVTIAKILREDGTEPVGWMYHADKGENFMVSGRLQGGGEIAGDIDGVGFEMDAYDSYWTEQESRWSHLTYEISFDISGIPTLRAFNYTEMNNYTFGKYMDYVYVNVTGWHDEYNEVSGVWEWVYGNYTTWDWREVEGLHWEWYYFNQNTGEWQLEPIPHRGPAASVAPDFCTVSGFSSWVDDGDLFATFLVNMSSHVPDTNYNWRFGFLNNTWYQDTTTEIGDYEIQKWNREWVYSFDYFGSRVYMEPVESQLAFWFTNGSLGSDLMVGKETPYIKIADEVLPLRVWENYQPDMGISETELLRYDYYNPSDGKSYYYYELANGTKISVAYVDTVLIFNVTAGNDDSFLTAMEYAGFWHYEGFDYYYWIDIDGNLHQGGPEYDTRNCNVTIYDEIDVTMRSDAWYLKYGPDFVVRLSSLWWNSREQCEYGSDDVGNLYKLFYNETDGFGYVDDGNQTYRQYSLDQVILADYQASEAILVRAPTHTYWYHETGSIKHEMPYPGVSVQYRDWYVGWYEMNNIQSEGGIVPAIPSLVYNGTEYPIFNITPSMHFVEIDDIVYTVDAAYLPHSVANGTDVWNATRIGFTGVVGELDNKLDFIELETIQYVTPDEFGWPWWDPFEGHYIFDLLNNGTKWKANSTDAMLVYEYDYDGTTFYSTQEYPFMMGDNITWYEYTLLNGSILSVPFEYSAIRINSTVVYTYNNGSGTVFDFQSETHYIYHWGRSVFGFLILNTSHPGYLFMNMNMGQRPIFEFDYSGTNVTAVAQMESIERMHQQHGYAWAYGPQPIDSTVMKNFYDFIIGMPEWGMWGVRNWDTNPENGALDLDGNLATTDDQYYVLEEYSSSDSWTHEWDMMWVYLMWNPNETIWGDEMNVNSWMGVDTFTWTYEWNQTFYWFDTSMTPLSSTEMQGVKDTILSPLNESKPGYWDISWMAMNVTWADIVNEAQEMGWDWITSNEQTWTWLSFGVGQDYGTSYEDLGIEQWLHLSMRYEFSGLMIWEDGDNNGEMNVDPTMPESSELTHYLIPDAVESVGFVTPGLAFGNNDTIGNIAVDLTDEVTWGVTFYNVNGTVFPYTTYGYWGWYDSMQTGSDLRTFDQRPTEVTIDELSFLVHFQGYLDEVSLNNYADIKVDNYVGNWDVDILGGRDNLENRSLALNYFADVNIDNYAFYSNSTLQDQTVSADSFQLEAAGAQFAEMIMGGVSYDWGKNSTARLDVVSHTTPMGTFSTAFESDNGQSATSWSFSSTMFYVSIGFPQWDGYSVYQDPVFVGYVSRAGSPYLPEGLSFGAFAINPVVPSSTDTVRVEIDILSVDPLYGVELLYSTDSENWWSTEMWTEGEGHYVGTIPPFDEGTTVYYKVVVHTPTGDYESEASYYVVGGRTTTTWNGGPGFLDMDMIVLIGGSAVMIIILGALIKRRRR